MTPALVLGAGHSTTLEVIRILGRRGIPQFAAGAGECVVSDRDGPADPARASRVRALWRV
jgi:hypothetical protein